MFSCEFGDVAVDEEGGGSVRGLAEREAWRRCVEVREFVEGPLPAVAFVFDEGLQHGEGGGLVVFGSEGDVAEEWRDAWEVRGFGEEAADLGVGIFAGCRRRKSLRISFAS